MIKVENLTLGYNGKGVAKGITFAVDSGDYLCVIGENGVGKSTLLKSLLELMKPIDGKISVAVPKNEIGYLPQQDDIQRDFPASVWEIVLSGCLNQSGFRPFYSKSAKQTAKFNIERANISNLTRACYRELSGGQQQRVLLARALCSAKKMIVLDEPTSGLDPIATQEMYKVISNINKNDGITVVMVSHDVENAVKYANKILSIGKDKSFFGTVDEYKKFAGGANEHA